MHLKRILVVAAVGFLGTMAPDGVASASPHHAGMSEHATARAILATVTNTQIINLYADLCLDAEDDSSNNPGNNGDKVQLWTCRNTANQQWTVHGGANSMVTITNADSGKCLDAVSGSIGNGDKIQLWTCNGGANQHWYVQNPGEAEPVQMTSTLVLDAENDSAGNPGNSGDKVQLWTWNHGLNQEWLY